MSKTTQAIEKFIKEFETESLAYPKLEESIEAICASDKFKNLLLALINSPAFSPELGAELAEAGAVAGISACRNLRSGLNFSLSRFFGFFAEMITAFDESLGNKWHKFADRIHQSNFGSVKLLNRLTQTQQANFYHALTEELVQTNPHAVFPTSSYRESYGFVESTKDDQVIEAVMGTSTFTSVRLVDRVLDKDQTILRDTYISLDRCVCLVDQNVEKYYGEQINEYFEHHGIPLDKLVYRAMEVDKGMHTVERMLGDFKRLGVSRNEPVLIVGGGVLTDTGGLACALYHRNTPYVMLSTSIVAGIDAGPSPRTCCDGFGYKNLFGAYHPPILSLTDRFFFKSLHEGWLRHGLAEIVKMATVKDAELFGNLEIGGPDLIATRFGTTNCHGEDEINYVSQRILGGALRSYVAAEYDNLYETHQCRPHAYGHTWSPGFEIEAGLLHGHAVAIGMGFGAYVSYQTGWISERQMHRILRLISSFGLSLWHDILLNKETLWSSQEKIFQKRGQNLAIPLPKGEIGQCGYLNDFSQGELYAAIDGYRVVCAEYPRNGLGIDPLCSDVGLEDPSTVAVSSLELGAPASEMNGFQPLSPV
ncbi:sedoheptulose 7-phosphate cyclase [[Limnothrix rosea] IAM M-220]|uniref:sedoheptulose 7-phosphate cyclase n=1 Tax=[Limnothrix rosea] IAM M-220 TaxID=454133 RepID=UPI000962D5DF|nr:sedoheptulose 7-phosphate cyclase [[Limnothrix rosea] IAM M-220]OKH11998.1 3-dehydroquinate synthase [[Limnothrix rosea] IAM M-220]